MPGDQWFLVSYRRWRFCPWRLYACRGSFDEAYHTAVYLRGIGRPDVRMEVAW